MKNNLKNLGGIIAVISAICILIGLLGIIWDTTNVVWFRIGVTGIIFMIIGIAMAGVDTNN